MAESDDSSDYSSDGDTSEDNEALDLDEPIELDAAIDHEPEGLHLHSRGIPAVLANLDDCYFPLKPGDRVLNASNLTRNHSLKKQLSEQDVIMLMLIDSFGITTRQLRALKILQKFDWWADYTIRDMRHYKTKQNTLPKLRTFLRKHLLKDGSVKISPHHSLFDIIRYRFLQIPGNYKKLVFHAQVAEAMSQFWHGRY
jgi:hypothetical protein